MIWVLGSSSGWNVDDLGFRVSGVRVFDDLRHLPEPTCSVGSSSGSTKSQAAIINELVRKQTTGIGTRRRPRFQTSAERCQQFRAQGPGFLD